MATPKKSKKNIRRKKTPLNKKKDTIPTAQEMKKILDKMFRDWKNAP